MLQVLVRTLRVESADRQMLAAVLSLIVTMTRNLMDAEDLPPLIDAINRAANGFSILAELQSMVTKLSMKSKVTIVNRLNTLKLITEIFILIVRHGSRYTVEEAENLMKLLWKAARNMSEIEDIMVISGCSSSLKTLGSLVKEAEELLPRERASEMEVIIEHPSCVNRNQINEIVYNLYYFNPYPHWKTVCRGNLIVDLKTEIKNYSCLPVIKSK